MPLPTIPETFVVRSTEEGLTLEELKEVRTGFHEKFGNSIGVKDLEGKQYVAPVIESRIDEDAGTWWVKVNKNLATRAE